MAAVVVVPVSVNLRISAHMFSSLSLLLSHSVVRTILRNTAREAHMIESSLKNKLAAITTAIASFHITGILDSTGGMH